MLLDLNMPVKNGFDVLAALAHDAQLKCIPSIVLTTSTRPEDIARCYELGANAYLEKPAGFKELSHVLKAVIEFWGECKFRLLAHILLSIPRCGMITWRVNGVESDARRKLG
jgi:CheY-like chemotaxis protein